MMTVMRLSDGPIDPNIDFSLHSLKKHNGAHESIQSIDKLMMSTQYRQIHVPIYSSTHNL